MSPPERLGAIVPVRLMSMPSPNPTTAGELAAATTTPPGSEPQATLPLHQPPPIIQVARAVGVAGTPIALPIDVQVDSQEFVTIFVTGLPAGASLSSGIRITPDRWMLLHSDLPGLTLTTPEAATFTATVTVAAGLPEYARVSTPAEVVAIPPEPLQPAAEPEPSIVVPLWQTPEFDTARPAPPMPPPTSPLPEDLLLKRGDALIAEGDVVGARLFFERAAGLGSSRAATAVAKTLDPLIHRALGVRGASANPWEAVEWYREAAQRGDPEAKTRLRDLKTWLNEQNR